MNQILDEQQVKVNLLELRQKLISQGFPQTYGDEVELVVEESDVVRVKVSKGYKLQVQEMYPKIGNIVQILVTALMLVSIGFLGGGFLGMIVAICAGQGASLLYYRPKIKALAKKVRNIAYG